MDEYFSNVEHVSNSMLSWLNESPKYFKSKLDRAVSGVEDKSSAALALGTMIHMSLLEPDKFKVSEVDAPTAKMLAFCDGLIATGSMELAYELSGYSQSLETIKSKYYKSNGPAYVEERTRDDESVFIDLATKFKINKCLDSIINNDTAFHLLNVKESEEELEIYWEKDGIKKKCKVDKLVLSRLEENIVVNVDLKTTSNNVFNTDKDDKKSFMHSYYMYGYDRQQAMYDEGIKHYIKEKYGRDVEVMHVIIAVETSKSFNCATIEYGKPYIEEGKLKIQDLLEKYEWHTKSNSWNYPKDYPQGYIKL